MKSYLFFIILIFNSTIHSQSNHFKHITTNDGISQSEIYSFLEDSRGYIWFGTVDGLNLYDGYNITIFNTEKDNHNSLTHNTVRSLVEDKFGRIWIGTDAGLSLYNPLSETIHQIHVAALENKLFSVNALLVQKNHLILGTSHGLLRVKLNTNNLKDIGNEFQWVNLSEKQQEGIVAIEHSKNGSIWLSSFNAIYRILFQRNNNNPIVIETIVNTEIKSIKNLNEDNLGNLWIVSQNNGFFRFNPYLKKIEHFSKNRPNESIISNNYSSVTSDKDGNLWIGTRDRGLLFLEAENLNHINPQFKNIKNEPFNDKSLNSNLIYSLYVSKNNLIWVGTIGSGINIYNTKQNEFNYYKIQFPEKQLPSGSNFIRSVYSDKNDIIWIGTHNNGLYLFNREKNTFFKGGFDTESIFYIYDIGNGNTLICGAQTNAIVKLVNNEVKIQSINPKILNATFNATFNAVKSKDDIIWVAGHNGLNKYTLSNGQMRLQHTYNSETTPRISFNNCRVVFYNNKLNELFLGTEGGGLNILKLDKNHDVTKVSVYKENGSPNSLSNNYVRSIIKDSKGNIWVGTYEGLNKILRDSVSGKISFKNYTLKDGLPNNMIQSLVEDNQNQLWIGTNDGLVKLDTKNEQFVQYSLGDGIQSNEFSEHAVFKNSDGEIIIGGINGFNIFDPEKITNSIIPPKTTITDFYLFNEKVNIVQLNKKNASSNKTNTLYDTIYLKPNENSFGFSFSSMSFSNPDRIKYAYMLEGFDKEWKQTDSKNRRANYTNLKHGTYNFKLKATNNIGEFEKIPNNIFIKIKTPFYYTWVAYIIYTLMGVFIIFGLTNYSVIRYNTKKKIVLENEHNKKIQELNELRTRFFINISHDLRTPLTLISNPLELILKNNDLKEDVSTQLKLMQRNIKKLLFITEQLLDFRKARSRKLLAELKKQDIVSFLKNEVHHFNHEIKTKGLELNIMSIETPIYVCFDPDMISKVIFNLLSNAIKYTNRGEINIRIDKVSRELPNALKNSSYKNFIKIDVQDSGVGISKYELDKIFERFYQAKNKTLKGYGIGLSHCKDLIDAHDGIIEAISEKGTGTIFSFYIPDIQMCVDQKEIEFTETNTVDGYLESFNTTSETESFIENTNLKNILIVEDNHEMRNFMKNVLSKEYNVIQAKDGIEGLEMAGKLSPDLIISDIMMPNMNGIEFCEKIKTDIKTSHIPVILLTAKADNQSKYEGLETGADDYISKPFDMQYLSLRIKNLLTTREQLRKLFQKNNNLEPSAVTLTSLDEIFLSKLVSSLEKGIQDPEFNINSLENEMGMSHSNFYRKIKNVTGQSGKEILQNMRMKRAKQILTDNKDIRISEVAFMVGFTNPKYFSKTFKKTYGKLPSEIKG